jgi:hypothetical protein
MLEPEGLLVDLHPVMPNPRIRVGERDLGPIHQEEWAREWLRPTESELRKTVRAGLFEPLAELAFQIVHRHDDAQELVEEIDEWEEVWISPRLRRRILASQPPIDMTEGLVLRTYRAR